MQLDVQKKNKQTKKQKTDKSFQTYRCVTSWRDAMGPRANFDKDQFL